MKRIFQNTLAVILVFVFTGMNAFAEITPAVPSTVNGVYQISNAAELWGFAQLVNNGDLTANAVLTEDIDMGGEANGSFPGIGYSNEKCYGGVFDGQGHTISNFYQAVSGNVYRSGMFTCIQGTSATKKATVRNFTIKGIKTFAGTSAMHGVVVGDIAGHALLQDVNCEVEITATAKVAIWGGLVGTVRANGTVDRCRYSGTFNCGQLTTSIGGIAGTLRGGTISNCLFDGTIINNNANITLGGIAGATENNDNSKITNCFSHGTITLGASAGANIGIVLGKADKTISISNTYYTTTGTTNVTNPVGPGTTATATNVTGSADITNGTLCTNLGVKNWMQGENYPVPYVYKHVHNYVNGICSGRNDDCEDYFEHATLEGDAFVVRNAGQLLWCASHAQGATILAYNVTLGADIDLTGETWFDIVGYTGTFDGQGHTISGYSRTCNSTHTAGFGFFNTTNGATIRNFTLKGTLNITGASNNSAFIGGVVGIATNTVIEDVTSSLSIVTDNTVNGTQNSGIRLVGGVVGSSIGSTINRCRYNGVMTLDASTAAIGDRFGGIAACTQTGTTTIKNCLYDGKMVLNKNSIILGGIIGRPLSGSLTISNCLSVGEFDLKSISNSVGKIIGNKNGETISCTYYTTSGIKVNGNAVTTGFNTHGTFTDGSNWAQLTTTLNNSGTETNWMIKEGQSYPIPVYIPVHEHNYAENNGICTVSGCIQKLQPATVASDGYYEIGNTGQLLWFGTKINDLSIAANSNARLTASIIDPDIPLPEFSGIGSAEHPYAGIFDGNNKAIQSSFTTASGTGSVGMFAYMAGTAENTATIKDLTLEGTFNVSAAREGIGALVGYMGDYALVDNVHSHVDINVTNAAAKYIGGLIGIMEEKNAEQTKLSMACYKNTIDVGNAWDAIGGLVGDIRGGTIENSLFDGEIKTTNTSTDLVVGGLAGQAYKSSGTYKSTIIGKCLSHGKITATGATSQKLGSVMGRGNQVVMSGSNKTTYYVNNGVTKAFGEKDANKSYETFTDASSMTKEDLRIALGEENWAQGDNYPYPQRGGTHIHSLDGDGFCVANDGEYQAATMVDGYYQIDNAGKLFWFAQSIGNGSIPADSKARIMHNIHMGGNKRGLFPMVGSTAHPFKGEFDGQGYTIDNIYMFTAVENATKKGMFVAASGANIHDFTVTGIFYIANNPGNIHGGITGETNGATYSDVNCAIDIQCLTETSTTGQIGGFAGIANGGSVINRCRFSGPMMVYSGVVTGDAEKKGDTHDAIGGMFGQSNNATITNCLFDGTITAKSKNSNLNVGGLIGYAQASTTMNNCFSHGTITIPTDKTYANCGAVVGRGTVTTSLSNYYTGTAKGNGTVNATEASPASIHSYHGLLYKLGDTNWYLDSEETGHYPTPKVCEHVHRFANGFCLGNDELIEQAEVAADGRYTIANAGQLWWIAQEINAGRIEKNARIKLVASIDMEGDAHSSFPGICPFSGNDWNNAFQGIFDGQGYTISNFYREVTTGQRLGLFNTTNNATIKNFNINGRMTVSGDASSSGKMIGVVVGHAYGKTTIEDINSSVNINANGVQSLGGIVGCMEDIQHNAQGKMNRCRYNGTITLANPTSGSAANSNIGGLVGEIRSASISNSLFDGTISIPSGVRHQCIGGWVGLVDSQNNSEIRRCLSHGTISIADYSDATISENKATGSLAGAAVGSIRKTLYEDRCFFTTAHTGQITQAHGAQIERENNMDSFVTHLCMGSCDDKSSNLADLYSAQFRTTLGESNWAEVEAVEGNYTYPKKQDGHIHKYEDGFCTSGDGEYEVPSHMGKTYQIDNGGKLYWLAEQFNQGNVPQDATIEIMKDINMHGDLYTYSGIGTESRPFTGRFEGHSHNITGFRRDIFNDQRTGLINYSQNATITSFAIDGYIKYNLATAQSFHGSVVGYAAGENTLIEDVISRVDLYIQNTRGRVVGGIAGRASGTINRCQYSGHIAALNNNEQETYTTSGEQIAGICANAQSKLTISNTLFDGKIWAQCTEPIMRVSGFLASNEKNSGVRITIQNCIFNGCLDLKHVYVQPEDVSFDKNKDGDYIDSRVKQTDNGIIAGFWDSGIASAINNVYYVRACDNNAMSDMTVGSWATDPTTNTSSDATTDANWTTIIETLNNGSDPESPNWTSNNSGGLPVPNTQNCSHVYNEYGFCSLCGVGKPLVLDTDNKYKMDDISALASFRDLVNSGTVEAGTVLNAKLTQDIDFAEFGNDFGEPIGNSYFNRYLYNFDGQGYTIRNVSITADNEYVGFFGYAGDNDHDCYIHDFTIIGEINSPYDSKEHDDQPLYMGVIGKMYRGKIENVHSQLTMNNTSPTRAKIGGILGCAETEGENAVVIDKCSYSGICNANAVGDMGGIVGRTSKNTLVKNCTFAGTMNHTYAGSNNTTQFGGIVGMNEDPGFKGVKNCVIAGVLNTDKDRVFVSYGEEGNHKNILAGYDTKITNNSQSAYDQQYTGNYALEDYQGKFSEITTVEPHYVSQEQMANGEVCAMMNGLGGADWGQIIGYQLSGNKTAGSPAQRVPYPGYLSPEKTSYKVVKDASDNYTIDYLYLDDAGDATPLPSDAATIKAKKIDYTRPSKYMTPGFISVCMPFALNSDKLPGGENCKVKVFDQVKEKDGANYVYFKDATAEADGSYAAGVPYFLYLPEGKDGPRGKDWSVNLEDANGFDLAIQPNNPETGILGSFCTVKTGAWSESAPMYKIKNDGVTLVKTTASSNCYPYRGYLKLPASSNGGDYRLSFDGCEGGNENSLVTIEEQGDKAETYNLYGLRTDAHARGMIIRNGKIQLRK